ncbi:hypothetical protein ACOME3_005442 [Neoechinorhynchus agilis]
MNTELRNALIEHLEVVAIRVQEMMVLVQGKSNADQASGVTSQTSDQVQTPQKEDSGGCDDAEMLLYLKYFQIFGDWLSEGAVHPKRSGTHPRKDEIPTKVPRINCSPSSRSYTNSKENTFGQDYHREKKSMDNCDSSYSSNSVRLIRKRKGKIIIESSSDDDSVVPRRIEAIIEDDNCDEQTRLAMSKERSRLKRLESKGAEIDHKSIILDYDSETKKPLLSVHPSIANCLKKHQIEGCHFLYDNCIETIENNYDGRQLGGGCVLAHCMGLGKTFTVIAFLQAVLTHFKLTQTKSALILSPKSGLTQWSREFQRWQSRIRLEERVDVIVLDDKMYGSDKLKNIQDFRISIEPTVLIMTYCRFRNIIERLNNSRDDNQIRQALLNPGPDLLVCDEGHILKNERTNIYKVLSNIRTPRRIVMTGTPLQNNLAEYHCMVHFIKPNYLGTRREFNNRFITPIQNGLNADSTWYDVKLMMKRTHILHEMLGGCVHRRDSTCLQPYLPNRYEYVISIRPSKMQAELYRLLVLNKGQTQSHRDLLNFYIIAKRICAHPFLLWSDYKKKQDAMRRKRDKLRKSGGDNLASHDGDNEE